jgi:hypothetical protein
MTARDLPELLPCPGCGDDRTRVIGGPGTKGGPQYWVGCDVCRWRTWGNTEAEAISAWNTRAALAGAGAVAWVNPNDLANPYFVSVNAAKPGHQDMGKHYTMPLFTHPAPVAVGVDEAQVEAACVAYFSAMDMGPFPSEVVSPEYERDAMRIAITAALEAKQ